jgi:hypothetical protein
MTTSDWALIISLCSFAVALSSFIWNVWSKFIYPKAKVRVAFQASIIFHPGYPEHESEFLSLVATNLGPGDVLLHSSVEESEGEVLARMGSMVEETIPIRSWGAKSPRRLPSANGPHAAPSDEIEGALAVQMACTHTAAMAVLARLGVDMGASGGSRRLDRPRLGC